MEYVQEIKFEVSGSKSYREGSAHRALVSGKDQLQWGGP